MRILHQTFHRKSLHKGLPNAQHRKKASNIPQNDRTKPIIFHPKGPFLATFRKLHFSALFRANQQQNSQRGGKTIALTCLTAF